MIRNTRPKIQDRVPQLQLRDIATVKRGAGKPEGLYFFIYQGRDRNWYWRLKAKNNRIIADSGEGYTNKGDCVAIVETIQKQVEFAAVRYSKAK